MSQACAACRYGRNELLGSARTEHTSAHLVSVRLNESVGDSVDENKKIAYLIDLQTIRVLDLVSGISIATITHDTKVVFACHARSNTVKGVRVPCKAS